MKPGPWPDGTWVNPDFADLLRALSAADAKFLVVGGYAVSFHSQPRTTGDLGVVPRRIDILTRIEGVKFDEAWPDRVFGSYGGITFALIGKEALIRNKRAVGRPRDLIDVACLEKA